MDVCVWWGGVSVINIWRTIEDGGDDDKLNATDYVVTGELTVPTLTADIVDKDIGEA